MQKKCKRQAHKVGLRTIEDLPDSFTFGLKKDKDHDMLKLLTNSYLENEGQRRQTIEEIRNINIQKKRLPLPPKATQAQLMRERTTKIK